MLKGWGAQKAFEALDFNEFEAVEWLNWPPVNVIVLDCEWFVRVVEVEHLSDAEAIAFAVADNRTAQLAEPDNAQLAKLLMGVKGQGDGSLLAAGYSDEQLAGLLGQFSSNADIDYDKEWEGMPEFDQPDDLPHQSILVHFPTPDDIKAFFKLINQPFTERTRFIYYPELIVESQKRFAVIDDEP